MALGLAVVLRLAVAFSPAFPFALAVAAGLAGILRRARLFGRGAVGAR
jgi:hypothetical protein